MKIKLSDIASVHMGYSFRGKIVPDLNGNTTVIQMKDLTEANLLATEGLLSIKHESMKEQYRVEQFDLVFRSRGHTNTAAIIQYPIENAMLAAPLFRIRVTDNKILPEYLYWLINQRSTQIKILRLAQGTRVHMVDKNVLEELDILIPSIETQKKIIALNNLSNQEQDLMKRLSEKKGQLIKGYMMRLSMNSQ